MDISNRIIEIRKVLGLNKVQLGKLVGVSHSAVGQWESGETKELKYDVLKALEKNTGYRMQWIAEGIEPKRYDERTFSLTKGGRNVKQVVLPINKNLLPVVSFDHLVSWSKEMNPKSVKTHMAWPFEHSETDYVLEMQGVSMWNGKTGKGYSDGCYLRISPDISPENGDDVVACTPDGVVSFVQYHKTGPAIYLEAINPDWPDRITKAPEGTKVLGVCVEHIVRTKRKT
jgi:SOS-response transcriptional repressor LexA